MADHELTPEEDFRRLNEPFGSHDPSAPPTRGCRKSSNPKTYDGGARPFEGPTR